MTTTDQPKYTAQLHKMLDYCIRHSLDYYLDMRRQQLQISSNSRTQDMVIPFSLIESVSDTKYFKEGTL